MWVRGLRTHTRIELGISLKSEQILWVLLTFETSCAAGAPLRMKQGRIEEAAFQRKDDQRYTASERVFETVPRCLDEPLPVVLPLLVVDNSVISPIRLTAHLTRLTLASQGALPSSIFKQRGFICPFMCSCSCWWFVSSSRWRGSGVLAGSLFGHPLQKARPSAAGFTVCSSRARQTIAPPVDVPPLPRRLESRYRCRCVPGARSKAAGELWWLLGISVP